MRSPSCRLREESNLSITYAIPACQTERIKRLPSAATSRSLRWVTESSTIGIEEKTGWPVWTIKEQKTGYIDTAGFPEVRIAIPFSPSEMWRLLGNVPCVPDEQSEDYPYCLEYPPLNALVERFQQLASAWRSDTAYLSDLTHVCNHWAYQQIIAMGWPVVPLILRELEANPDYWFSALQRITGENPVPAPARGQLKEMASAWLEWGRANGISQ
jgi:hypothetical protein